MVAILLRRSYTFVANDTKTFNRSVGAIHLIAFILKIVCYIFSNQVIILI